MRAILLLLLVGCGEVDEMTVKRVYAKDEAELRRYCGNDLVVEPLGCALVRNKSCTIVAFQPRGYDDHRRVETLGHELMHCFDGPKHT